MTEPKPEAKTEAPSERCETCRFALRADENTWVCRRYPPTHFGESNDGFEAWESSQDTGTWRGNFQGSPRGAEQPEVDPVDWCGEWSPKP